MRNCLPQHQLELELRSCKLHEVTTTATTRVETPPPPTMQYDARETVAVPPSAHRSLLFGTIESQGGPGDYHGVPAAGSSSSEVSAEASSEGKLWSNSGS